VQAFEVRCVAHLQKQQQAESLQRVVIKRNGRALLLRVEQIDCIEAAGITSFARP
jgi:hypothetical protein